MYLKILIRHNQVSKALYVYDYIKTIEIEPTEEIMKQLLHACKNDKEHLVAARQILKSLVDIEKSKKEEQQQVEQVKKESDENFTLVRV